MADAAKRRRLTSGDHAGFTAPSWVPTSGMNDFASLMKSPALFCDFDFDVGSFAQSESPSLSPLSTAFSGASGSSSDHPVHTTSPTPVPPVVIAAKRSHQPASRISATMSKACGYCALTWCQQCIDGSQQDPPVSCHVPEHGRSVCSTCASSHRLVAISIAHSLYVPRALEAAFEEAFQEQSSSGSLIGMAEAEIPPPFSFFYTHLNGCARAFEIFDAVDDALWQEALPYSRIYVFGTEQLTRKMYSMFPTFLVPLVGEAPGTAANSLMLRLCAQCCAYQVQHPRARVSKVAPTPFNKTGSHCIPNFYSASLCRKNNASHLKKQRLPVHSAVEPFPVLPPATVAPRVDEPRPVIKFEPMMMSKQALEQCVSRTSASVGHILSNASGDQSPNANLIPQHHHAFRELIAFQMLLQHRFTDFCNYLAEFSIDRAHEPLRAVQFDMLGMVATFNETLKMGLFPDQNNQDRTNRPANALTNMMLTVVHRMSQMEGKLTRLLPVLGEFHNPMSVIAPSLFIADRLLHFSTLAMRSNCAFLSGIPENMLQFQNIGFQSLGDIQHVAANLLDAILAIKDVEVDHMLLNGGSPNALQRSILHANIGILWITAVMTSKARETRRRVYIQQYAASRQSGQQHLPLVNFQLPPIEVLAPDHLYQQGIMLALSHAGGRFDLAGIANMCACAPYFPQDTVLAAALPLFLSQALDEIAYGLTSEMVDPSYAFSSEQLIAKGIVGYTQDVGGYASSQYTDSDVESMMGWTICFDNDFETNPSFFFCPLFRTMLGLHYTEPAIDLSSQNAETTFMERQTALSTRFAERKGQTWETLPRCESGLDLQAMNLDSLTPPRSKRSLRGLRLMQLVLGLAQKVQDSSATAFCVLNLAQLLIYWCPHYDLAISMLQRLREQCTELLVHMPEDVGPAYARSFIKACQNQAALILHQFACHRAAGLASPFFIGSLIELNFAAGKVEGVLCSVDVASPLVVICEHPQMGLIWIMLYDIRDIDSLCQQPSVWKNVGHDVPFDCPLISTLYGHSHRALVHEIRLGRYSFAQMLHDVRLREQFAQ